MYALKRLLRRPFFIKLFNWEYWSFTMIYIWIYPVWLFLCFRARSFFFFSASNPSIKNGGFLTESKKQIHAIIPPNVSPKTEFFNAATPGHDVLQKLRENNFSYPLIGKPDTGGRGRGVKMLTTDDEVIQYSSNTLVDYHIQEFINYEHEVGIFYYRYPQDEVGKISGIVRKEFLKVKGDGKSSIHQLLEADTRSVLQIKNLQKMYGEYLEQVLPSGVEKTMVPYGNHARGAKFLDDSHLADAKLTDMMNTLCKDINGFYYGRLDIKYNSWKELKDGKNFRIIEINGAGAEPTHIFDPRHTIFFAWKEIIRHWIILWRISRINHKKGYPYLSIKEGISMFREDELHSKKLSQMPV